MVTFGGGFVAGLSATDLSGVTENVIAVRPNSKIRDGSMGQKLPKTTRVKSKISMKSTYTGRPLGLLRKRKKRSLSDLLTRFFAADTDALYRSMRTWVFAFESVSARPQRSQAIRSVSHMVLAPLNGGAGSGQRSPSILHPSRHRRDQKTFSAGPRSFTGQEFWFPESSRLPRANLFLTRGTVESSAKDLLSARA